MAETEEESTTASSKLNYASILEEGKAAIRQTFSRTREKGEEMINSLGITKDDLGKLDRVPLICGLAGLIINIVLIASRYSVSWGKGTALYDGEPFTVHFSLSDAMFGDHGEYTKYIPGCPDTKYCSLNALAGDCTLSPDAPTFAISGELKSTSPEMWCKLRDAGGSALGLLWTGFVPGLGATLITLIYAAKEIPKVGAIFDTLEAKGFTNHAQKLILSLCWAALWVFMFVAMTAYASGVPDTLGVGNIKFEAAFGLLRLCFLLVSGFGSLLVTSLFELWRADNVAEAYSEFAKTKLFSAKKLLYYLLLSQLVLYLLLSIKDVRWEMLLVFIAGYYLDAKVKNFMLLYIAIVTVTLLLDVIYIGGLPSFDSMTPGESFTNVLFVLIFLSKFAVLGAIYFYEKENDVYADSWQRYQEPAGGATDEIAE